MSCSAHPTRNDFITAAREYLGVPFVHQGRDRRGLDCLGLVVCAARDVGVIVHNDDRNYGRQPDYRTMRAGLMQHLATVPLSRAAPGDLFWLKWRRSAYPMHLAIYLGSECVIHADGEHAKCVTEHAMPAQWRECIVTALQFRGF